MVDAGINPTICPYVILVDEGINPMSSLFPQVPLNPYMDRENKTVSVSFYMNN
jgi:hypothetical protein